MNPLQQLSDYLGRMERNLRLLTLARGTAILFGAALAMTLALVLVMNSLSFSDPSVFYSRLILFFILAAALSAALITPLLRLNQKRVARLAERRHPELGQRLLTFVERRHSSDAFLPLLAADALPYAATASPEAIAAPSTAMAFGTVAVVAAMLLLWLGMRGPGYFGYGTSLLWGISKEESKPFYSVSIQPGNHRVRRHADQLIDAHLNGFFSRQASLFVRYASATRWEETPMRPQTDGSAFQFLLVGVPEDVEYYVVSNGIHSNTAKLTAVDLPAITHLRVTYHFPPNYGMKDATEDPGGDLRALQGTVADVEIQTDKPLASGSVIVDDSKPIELTGQGVTHHASVPIEKDGTYHFATPDGGETVRLSDDYFIEARPDSPPTITVKRPLRDARVTPIEELPVELEARDDNGIQSLDLHYSVNGGAEQVRSLLSARGVKEATGTSLLSLEDYKLVPGDIVTLYATARDAKTTAKSDIFFVEARPFQLNYHQEQAGGGSGESQDQPKMAERQKEIIAATFNQLKNDKHDAAMDAENAKYLGGVQSKLREEAQSLENRMKARSIEGSGTEFQQFLTAMQSAVEAMAPAAEQLRGKKWNDALSPEQKALQYLLRAEAIYRDISVVMSQSGGGGGGKAGASRDLEGLTSLELDTQKNQYESGNQSAADQAQKEADEALKKLEELARRQQELARQQQQNPQNFQQRWQQEMLRREAEQLRKKLEELAKNQQSQQGQSQQGQQQQSQGQQSQGQQSSSQSPGQQGSASQQGSQGQQSQSQSSSSQQSQSQQSQSPQPQSAQRNGGRFQRGTQQALEKALQNLTEAERKMGEAASHGSGAQAAQAAEELNRAESEMAGMRHDQNGSDMSNLEAQARRLAGQQEKFDEKLRHSFADGAAGGRTDRQNDQLNAQLGDEKKREIEDLHQLEHSLQQTARGMQNTQPDAARKLRDAIGQMQQDELESRMKWTADALSRKLGSYAVMREAPVTRGLNELKDRLADAASSMTAPGSKTGESSQALEQALARAEKLRKNLQAMSGREPGADKGSQSGQGKEGQGRTGQGKAGDGKSGEGKAGQGKAGQGKFGESQSGQPGTQPGNSQASASQGGSQSGGAAGSANSGGAASSPSGGPAQGEQGDSQGFGPRGPRSRGESAQTGFSATGGSWDSANSTGSQLAPDPARAQREYEEAVREIGRLQPSVQSDPDVSRQLQDLQRDLQRLDPRRVAGDPARLLAVEQQIVAAAEQAELILRRKLEDSGSIRTTAPQNIPPGYATAVAEYFRRLSR